MSSEYETGKQRLEGLCGWYSAHMASRNEATTRLHLIDEILFECLGWDKRTDCVSEERFDGKYSDYTLLCPRRTVIVEAKKEGNYFDIPAGFNNREYNISTLIKDIPSLGGAIRQAAGYCQERGTPFGIVTNGHQFVGFIGSRQDGLPPEEGRAVVFESLESMLNDFRLFWDLFSKPGIIERNLLRRLIGIDTPLLPKKLSEVITPYPGVKNRNILQTDLQILADLIFEDIISAYEFESVFLQKCYCQSGALSQYALVSKSLLYKRYEGFFSGSKEHPAIVPAVDKKGISQELIAESFSRRPILVLGDVGVGKTIFFRHFITIDAKELFHAAIVIYIDFGSKAAFAKDLRDFILDDIARQLLDKYDIDIFEDSFVRAVNHGALQRFAETIYGRLKESDPKLYALKEIEFLENKLKNKEQYIIDSLTHIVKGRRRQIVFFLDNADQRTEDIQQQVFIIGQSMSSNWPATVFLALRPETFQRSKQFGSLSAYHLKAFTIAPPRIDEVLTKRLKFGLEITSGNIPSSALPRQVTVNFEKVGAFLSIVLQSIERSYEILECVDNLSGGNVRLALEFVRRLIGSGHIDTRKILEIYNKTGRYFIRLHEFLRSVIYGDAIYYDPSSSPLDNLFMIESLDKKEHFISLIMLKYVARQGAVSSNYGFVDMPSIYDFLQSLGFMIDQIDICISRIWRKKLVPLQLDKPNI